MLVEARVQHWLSYYSLCPVLNQGFSLACDFPSMVGRLASQQAQASSSAHLPSTGFAIFYHLIIFHMDSRNRTWVLVLNLHDKHLTDRAINLKDFFLFGYFVVVVLFLLRFLCVCVMGMIMTQKIALVSMDILPMSSSSHENPVLLSFRCSILTRAWQES